MTRTRLPNRRGSEGVRIFRYVRLHDVERWMRCGWLPTEGLEGTPHGHWSVLMAWICDCPPREPA